MRDAKRQRQSNEYMQNMMRYDRSCDIQDLFVLIVVYKDLNKELKRDVRRSTKHTIVDEFIRDVEKVIEF